MMEMVFVAPLLFGILFFVFESGLILTTRNAVERGTAVIKSAEISYITSDERLSLPIDERFRRADFLADANAFLAFSVPASFQSMCGGFSGDVVVRRYFVNERAFLDNTPMALPLSTKPAVMTIEVRCAYPRVIASLFSERVGIFGSVSSRAVIVTGDL
jgi:Flp pilus assembly protein TadG